MHAIVMAAVLSQCGVHVSLPKGWRSRLRTTDNPAVVCAIDFLPARGTSASVSIEIFAPSASYEEAVDEAGFEREDDKIGFYGMHGHLYEAMPFDNGNLKGVRATAYYGNGQGQEDHILAKMLDGAWTAVECKSSPPDAAPCDDMMALIARTLRRTR